MAFTAGQKVRASELNRLGQIVGRNQRTTDSTQGSAIARVLSTIATVRAGRSYRVTADGEVFGNSGAVTTQNELRFTTDNTEPLTTSPVMGRSIVRSDSTVGTPDQCHIEALFHCVADGTLRVVVCITRVAGAVNVAWTAAATFPMILTVEDIGDTVAVTGTVY